MKLNVKALAFSLAITWAFTMLCLGWVSMFGWGYEAMDVAASFYIGYGPTFEGGLIGAVWGFFDGLIGGAIIGWLYNWIAMPKKVKKIAKSKKTTPKKTTAEKKPVKRKVKRK
jgi:hypothetical protein